MASLSENDSSSINLNDLSEAGNLTKIDIDNSKGNVITGVTAGSLINITGGSNTLTIDGDDSDWIEFTGTWATTTYGFDTHYTYTSGDNSYVIIDTNGGMNVI